MQTLADLRRPVIAGRVAIKPTPGRRIGVSVRQREHSEESLQCSVN